MVKGFDPSAYFSIGEAIERIFNVSKDSYCSGPQCHCTFFLVRLLSGRAMSAKLGTYRRNQEHVCSNDWTSFRLAADNLEHSIKKFWEIENVEIVSVKTSELDICKDHFKSTHSRDGQGRYTVAMPLKEDPSCLGESRQTAIQSLNSLWKRLSRDKEYLSL
ncbi:DUF1758 domain-containing protein [Trichonephila clavipes]|nr:DUF1758 domain-containing protein [Trichonephila clavipes]